MKLRIEVRRKAALASLFIAWVSVVSSTAQTFTTLKSFGNLTNIAGFGLRSQLAQGPDGALYGTTSYRVGGVQGTVFKIQPDGSGFAVLKWFTNSVEGARPMAGLTFSGNTLYGTTYAGGSSNSGTVFKLHTDGMLFAVLRHFGEDPNDGRGPVASVTLSGSVLYGTTAGGGSSGLGTVFRVNTDGTGYTVLKEFVEDGVTGWQPYGHLTLSGNTLYGTTFTGGSSNVGTLFKLNTDGTGYSTLKGFPGFPGDGVNPAGGLALSDGVLYGTTSAGGNSDCGTVFRVNTDGTGYTVLRHFTRFLGEAHPSDDLTLADGVLYGTTRFGGSNEWGTVFKMYTDGTGYTVLKQFSGSDGADPQAGLALSGTVLYGTTYYGGNSDEGIVFKVNTDGTGYAVLKNFALPRDEVKPRAGLALSGATLYGTTEAGGNSGSGTVFRLNTDGTGYTVLKHFPGFPGDGTEPSADLTLSDGAIYGTTSGGNSDASGWGTVFKMNMDGTGYQVLKAFSGSAGAAPYGRLALSGSVLYGTTFYGGISNAGTVFKVNTDGTGHTVLRHFTWSPSDGASPGAGVTVSGSVLYGTTMYGGESDGGTLFRMNTDGTGFTLLRSFAGGDGAWPGGLILSGDVLYGTAGAGGSLNFGTVFNVNTDGTGFALLKDFAGGDGKWPPGLILSDGVLYGTTTAGGNSDLGTVFQVNTDGTGYGVLKHFTGSDGDLPIGRLTLSGGTLYGTTSYGGALDFGTVFKLELSAPIALTAQSLGNAIVLSWSNPAFALQAAPAVTGIYTNVSDATSPYTNAISEPQRFFRLVGSW